MPHIAISLFYGVGIAFIFTLRQIVLRDNLSKSAKVICIKVRYVIALIIKLIQES